MNRYLSDKEWLGHITFPLHKENEKLKPIKPQAAPPQSPIQEAKAGGLKDIAGMDELKQLIQESFINVLRNKECAKAFGIPQVWERPLSRKRWQRKSVSTL